MHDEARKALEEAIRSAIGEIKRRGPVAQMQWLTWRRGGEGQWSGSLEPRPNPIGSGPSDEEWKEIGKDLCVALTKHHPDHLTLVGTASTGSRNWESGWLLMMAVVGELWSRQPDGNFNDTDIQQMVDEVAALVSGDTVAFKVIAPLVNFKLEGDDEISLPADLSILRLSEEEITLLHGGPYPFLGRWDVSPTEFAIKGELTERKVLGNSLNSDMTPLIELRERLDRVVMALRTFKYDPVGYQRAMLLPTTFIPVGLVTRTFSHEYVPLGSYLLSGAEVPAFQEHAKRLMGGMHQTLEIACSRLADAAIRLKDRDRLIDAVIGLEAILLKNTDELKYRGEVRYRFAMNYASLFRSPEEKESQFLVARDVYDLRSNIAHGGELKSGRAKIGREELSLTDAAKKACEMLRELIQRFSSSADRPKYLGEAYWRNRLFADNNPD